MEPVSTQFGRESQSRGQSVFTYYEGGNIPSIVATIESTARRAGVLEKASKEFLKWKPRRCVLMSDVLCYTKTEAYGPAETATKGPGKALPPKGSREEDPKEQQCWTCIPLRNCMHIVALPHDPRVLLLQTKARAYYWRAVKQKECEEWVAAIADQCALLRENDLLQEAEEQIVREEEQRASQMLACLKSLRQLEGALLFNDTRELLEGLAVDYFRSREEQRLESGEWATQCAQVPNSAFPRSHQDKAEDSDAQRRAHSPFSLTPCENVERRTGIKHDSHRSSSITAEEVLAYIRSYEARRGGHSEANKISGGFQPTRTQEVHRWIKSVLFPRFKTSPILQRRVAQLAASHNVISWGCDPLRGPLLWAQENTEANAQYPHEE